MLNIRLKFTKFAESFKRPALRGHLNVYNNLNN